MVVHRTRPEISWRNINATKYILSKHHINMHRYLTIFFIHEVKSDVGNYEFCKILCRNGHWRGPVCRVEIDDIKGKERISNSLGGMEANIISCWNKQPWCASLCGRPLVPLLSQIIIKTRSYSQKVLFLILPVKFWMKTLHGRKQTWKEKRKKIILSKQGTFVKEIFPKFRLYVWNRLYLGPHSIWPGGQARSSSDQTTSWRG